MDTKKCNSCQEVKSTKYFGLDKQKKDGFNNFCKPCIKIKYPRNKQFTEILSFENEVWLPVVGYDNKYRVSSIGRVISISRVKINQGRTIQTKNKVLIPALNKHGYCSVKLFSELSSKTVLVHRLVAEAFIPNPDNLPQVNHKNGIKICNETSNLEWVNNRENKSHMCKTRTHTSIYTGVSWSKGCKKWYSCIGIDKKTIPLGLFDNELEASMAYNDALMLYGLKNKYT